ncbi:cyclic-phosphate processing receiver domain-containing protein [Soonwooa purpurea]
MLYQKNKLPNFISFDHDLGEEKTGFDCGKFLVGFCFDYQLKLLDYTVHSQNPVGKENIEVV